MCGEEERAHCKICEGSITAVCSAPGCEKKQNFCRICENALTTDEKKKWYRGIVIQIDETGNNNHEFVALCPEHYYSCGYPMNGGTKDKFCFDGYQMPGTGLETFHYCDSEKTFLKKCEGKCARFMRLCSKHTKTFRGKCMRCEDPEYVKSIYKWECANYLI